MSKNWTVDELVGMVKDFRSERGWDNKKHKDSAISLQLEACEVLELFQWKSDEEVEGNSAAVEALGDELADVLYWVVIMSDELGLDVVQILKKKLEKQSRKYPLDKFGKEINQEEKTQNYHAIKSATRDNYPYGRKK